MSKRGFLVMLIAFAIIIQNTCPYGLAEKTAVASHYVHDCPMKTHHAKDTGGKSENNVRDIQKHFKTFNLLCHFIDTHPQPIEEAQSHVAMAAIKYDDDFIDLPIKPPMHSLNSLT